MVLKCHVGGMQVIEMHSMNIAVTNVVEWYVISS